MEYIVILIIIAVVYIMSFMRKLSSTDSEVGESAPRGSMSEVFPTIEIPVVAPKPAIAPEKKVLKKRTPPSAPKPSLRPLSSVAANEEKNDACENKNCYSIKDKSDAKKAIIYAELFNRKYF